MNCKICGQPSEKIFSARILRKYDIAYYKCNWCGFLQTEEPYWLPEAYTESITVSDTGILERNQYFAKMVSLLLAVSFSSSGKYVDYAGGYGIFTRLMRDIGFDFYWTDLHTKNLVARGFEYSTDVAPIEAVTAFETFEHLVNPISDIKAMLAISKTIIFSTQLLPDPVPQPNQWWYYVLEHGQHVSLYSRKTLEHIAATLSLHYYSFGLIHVFTPKRLNVRFLKFLFRFQRYGIREIYLKRLRSKTISDFESFRTPK
jgi:hypothetical protein